MTDQNKFNEPTRTVISDLVLSTNELTTYVISLLDSVSVDVDSLILQLKSATDKIDSGVADLESIRDKTLENIHQAQEDISGVYEVFMSESSKLRNDLGSMSATADGIDRRLDTLEAAQSTMEILYKNLDSVSTAIKGDITTSNIKIRDIQGRVSTAESDLGSLRVRLTNLAVELQDSQLHVADFESRMSTLEQKITAASTDAKMISDQIAKCVVDITQISQAVMDSNVRSREALDLAHTAYETVSNLTVDVGSLSTKLSQISNTYLQLYSAMADADANVTRVSSDVASLITNVTATAATLTNRLSAMEGDLQNAGIQLDQANSMLNQLNHSINMLDVDYRALSVSVKNQITEATIAARTANTSAEALASQVSVLTAQMVQYTAQADLANQNTQHLTDTLIRTKGEIDNNYNIITAKLDGVRVETEQLTTTAKDILGETKNISTEVSTKNLAMENMVNNVSSMQDYITTKVDQVNNEYLRKLEKAADAALFSGREVDYFAHDGNFDLKLDASISVAYMRGEISALKSLMSVDNESLNSLQEIVTFIEQNRQDLANLGIDNIAGLQAALNSKLDALSTAVNANMLGGKDSAYFAHDDNLSLKLNANDVISGIRLDVSSKSDSNHNHDGRYYATNADSIGSGDITVVDDLSRTISAIGRLDSSKGSIRAHSASSGAGEIFVGKNSSVGGGLVFGGVSDSSVAGKALGNGGENSLILFRQSDDDIREWTARNKGNSNNWEFRGLVTASELFEDSYRVFSGKNKPKWDDIVGKPIEATRWANWDEVSNKPSVFPPSTHLHAWSEILEKPEQFQPTPHMHSWGEITDKPVTFTPNEHGHYNVISQGRMPAWEGSTSPTYLGISMVQASANGYAFDYGNVLSMHGEVDNQLIIDDRGRIAVRAKGIENNAVWTDWHNVYTSLTGIPYADLTDIPTEFKPQDHRHKWSSIDEIPQASMAEAGIVQLNGSVNSSSETQAATASAVKAVYDLLSDKLSKTSDEMSGTLTVGKVLISGPQGSELNAVVRKDYADTKLAKNVSSYFDGYLLTKTADYMQGSVAKNLAYSGFYRSAGESHSGRSLPDLMIHVAHSQEGRGNAKGIGFSYGSSGWGAYITRWNHDGEYLGKSKLYSEFDKPTAEDLGVVPQSRKVNGKTLSEDISITAEDLGLNLVNNWAATSSVTDDSDIKYATASSVKKAYDLAANALAKTGGDISGYLHVADSVTSKMSGRGGISIGGGADYASISPMLAMDTEPLVEQGLRYYAPNDWRVGASNRIYHEGYLPTTAAIGALPTSGIAVNNLAIGVEKSLGVGMLMEIGEDDTPYISVNRAWRAVAFNADKSSTFGGELYVGANRVFHSGYLPSLAQLGLDNVQNWTYSNSYTGGSASKYATEKAVTDAYASLSGSKVSRGGDTFTDQMVFTSSRTAVAEDDLSAAPAVFGSLIEGLGVNSGKVRQKGKSLAIGVDVEKEVTLEVGGVVKAKIHKDGLTTEAVTISGGPTMRYNDVTGCLEITFN